MSPATLRRTIGAAVVLYGAVALVGATARNRAGDTASAFLLIGLGIAMLWRA